MTRHELSVLLHYTAGTNDDYLIREGQSYDDQESQMIHKKAVRKLLDGGYLTTESIIDDQNGLKQPTSPDRWFYATGKGYELVQALTNDDVQTKAVKILRSLTTPKETPQEPSEEKNDRQKSIRGSEDQFQSKPYHQYIIDSLSTGVDNNIPVVYPDPRFSYIITNQSSNHRIKHDWMLEGSVTEVAKTAAFCHQFLGNKWGYSITQCCNQPEIENKTFFETHLSYDIKIEGRRDKVTNRWLIRVMYAAAEKKADPEEEPVTETPLVPDNLDDKKVGDNG